MQLGRPDDSGRARPVAIADSEYIIDADTVITAIGQQVVLDFFPEKELRVNSDTYETQIEDIYAGGDAYRGASSLINAIADGQKAALSIIEKAGLKRTVNLSPEDDRELELRPLMVKQARRDLGAALPEKSADSRINFQLFMNTLTDEEAKKEAERCLQCDLVCNICTTVCPNRSNMFIESEPFSIPLEELNSHGEVIQRGNKHISQIYQIINIGDFCNECGNCTTFCPSSGRPFMDKPRFHITKESFDNSEFGFHLIGDKMLIKQSGKVSELRYTEGKFEYEEDGMKLSLERENLRVSEIQSDGIFSGRDLSYIAEYAFLFNRVRLAAPFGIA